MTLTEWAKWSGNRVQECANARIVPDILTGHERSALYRLSDYVVTSVRAGSIWLSPRIS